MMERTLNDSSLIQATIYFRYYVHQALKVAGMGDHLLDNLQIWRDPDGIGANNLGGDAPNRPVPIATLGEPALTLSFSVSC